jgi:hypothetical protein
MIAPITGSLKVQLSINAEAVRMAPRNIVSLLPAKSRRLKIYAAPNGRIQSKVGAYAHAGRSEGVNRRDVKVEQSWCDDVRALNALMQAEGFAADIVHEEGPGSAAQKPLPPHDGVREAIGTVAPR